MRAVPSVLVRHRAVLVLLAAALVAFLVTAQVLTRATSPEDVLVDEGWFGEVVPALGLALPGLVVLWRIPGHGVGRVLVLFGLWWAFDGWCKAYAGWTLSTGAPLGPPLWWVTSRAGAGLQLAMPLLLLLYPSGRLPGGRWRVPGWFCLLASGALLVVCVVVPARYTESFQPGSSSHLDRDYLSVDLFGPAWPTVRLIALGLLAPALMVAVARLVVLARGGDRELRTQARWLVWAALVDVLSLVSVAALELAGDVGWIAFTGGMALTGVSAAVGVLAPDVLDIGRVLSGTVVYGVVVVGLLVVDAAVVALVVAARGGEVAERDGIVVAILVVAVAYGPLRELLWRTVRRAVLGERVDRYRVVSELAVALESGADVGGRLQAITDAAARAFRWRYVAVEIVGPDGVTLRAETGSPAGQERVVPMEYRGNLVGRSSWPRRGAVRAATRTSSSTCSASPRWCCAPRSSTPTCVAAGPGPSGSARRAGRSCARTSATGSAPPSRGRRPGWNTPGTS